jgi:hypothetical protein
MDLSQNRESINLQNANGVWLGSHSRQDISILFSVHYKQQENIFLKRVQSFSSFANFSTIPPGPYSMV